MDFTQLSEPFPAQDVEWRVSRAGMGSNGIYCNVIAYITNRAIQQRLDDVCDPDGWRNEQPIIVADSRPVTFICGISIWCESLGWVTKWDVAEPTSYEAAKGAFSGAMKRAGCQWGIGRYLYHLPETRAEVSESGGKGWNWAKLSEKQGGAQYFWKTPTLPGWALPKDDFAIAQSDLNNIKTLWRDKFAADVTSPSELREGFRRFVHSVCGEFPVEDVTCWTQEARDLCEGAIELIAGDSGGITGVPFDE